MGLSSPNSSRIWSMYSGVTAASPTSTEIGSPGASWMSRKLTTTTPRRSGSAKTVRFTMNSAISARRICHSFFGVFRYFRPGSSPRAALLGEVDVLPLVHRVDTREQALDVGAGSIRLQFVEEDQGR